MSTTVRRRIFTSPAGSSGLSAADELRIQTLENNEYKVAYFTEVSSASGTITVPTGATILTEQLQGGVDAYVTVISNGQPTGELPLTGLGAQVDVSSFDALGNYSLTGTPSSFPVAIIYILKIAAINYSNLDTTKILDIEEVKINANQIGNGSVSNTEFQYLGGATSAIQTQLNNKQPLDPTLTALAGLDSTAGVLVQTAVDTFLKRNIAGTASNISVTNGDGVSGNPTIDLVNAGTAGTYGSAAQVAVIVTDSKGRVTSATSTTINILSTQISDFVEAAQDAIGNILTDSATIDFTYNDASNTITAIVINDSIDNTKLANMTTQTIKGRATAGTGDPEDLTGTQVKTIQGLATTTTDNAIVRFDGVTGNTQNSNATITDGGSVVLTSQAFPAYVAGQMYYDSSNECYSIHNNEADVTLNVGQESWIRVFNNTGSTIANGSAVYISGVSGGLPTVALARADSATTTRCVGLATHSIENNTIGYITNFGVVRSLDTSTFAPGTILFLSPTVAGGFTSTEPTGTVNYSFRIGIVVTQNATTGTIQVIPSTAMKASNLPGYQGYVINANGASLNPLDSTTYYFGCPYTSAPGTVANSRRLYFPKAGTIKAVYGFGTCSTGSNEAVQVYLRLNNTTDIAISLTVDLSVSPIIFNNTALSTAVVAGDYIEVKEIMPAFATNPTALLMNLGIYVE